jgi:ribosome-binding protein aMBF1 (putative translation factor)
MTVTLLDDPAHWQQRADEMHRLAKDMSDPAAKGAMLNIAAEYQVLVERARERRAAEKSSWAQRIRASAAFMLRRRNGQVV